MMTVRTGEERVQVGGGLTIFLRTWRAETAPRAVVIIVHGFNSHSGEYQWVAHQLVANGASVYAADLRGRGKSDGERFFIDRLSAWVSDVSTVVRLAKSREPGVPVFMLGHSAGGVVCCIYTLDNQQELAGLICESFAHEVPAPDFALAVFKGLSHIAPHAHILRLKNEDFSRDPAVVQAKNSDPLLAHEIQPTQVLAELVRADERLKREFANIMLPVLILHGTADKATRPSGSQRFYDSAASRDKTLQLYDGHFHDLLNDVGKEAVMQDITAWLAAHVGAAV